MELEKAGTVLGTYMDRVRADLCEPVYMSPIGLEAFLAVILANDEKLADLLNNPDAGNVSA